MGDGEHGGAQPGEEFAEFDDEAFAQRAVELSERFVEHEQPGAGGQGAGEGDALLLAAGQGGHRPPFGAGQSDQVEQFRDAGGPFMLRHAVHARAEGDVAADVVLREELVVLEHEADLAPVRGHGGLVTSVEEHAAAVQRLESGDGAQQGGLAAAAGAQDAHGLVFGDVQVDGVEGGPSAEADVRAGEAEQHQNSPLRSMRSRSRTSRARAHTTIRIVDRAIACP